MTKKLTIGIIGGGNMGAAILGGVRGKFGVCVSENDPSRQRFLKSTYHLASVGIDLLCKRSDILVLAVKPQDFDAILQELRGFLQKRHLVVSIAAGITTAYIEKRLGRGVRVVRTMPNLPLQVAMGVTAISRGKHATEKDAAIVAELFQTVGLVARGVSERDMNAITAISGSGPAYVFYFIECFVNSAAALGIKKDNAIRLIIQTMLGSLALLERSGEEAGTLRQRVTSKGGTTQAALEVFERRKFQKIFSEALKAAENRAKELSK